MSKSWPLFSLLLRVKCERRDKLKELLHKKESELEDLENSQAIDIVKKMRKYDLERKPRVWLDSHSIKRYLWIQSTICLVRSQEEMGYTSRDTANLDRGTRDGMKLRNAFRLLGFSGMRQWSSPAVKMPCLSGKLRNDPEGDSHTKRLRACRPRQQGCLLTGFRGWDCHL